jgi:hypothetical protein
MRSALILFVFVGLAVAAEPLQPGSKDIAGAWEFVSQTTVITEPKASKSIRAAPEWMGLWIFHDGVYSQVLTKRDRNLDGFLHPKDPDDLEFEGSAGSYGFEDGRLWLMCAYSFFPLAHSHRQDYEVGREGDTLTLIDTWRPHVEQMGAGTITIVLKRKH